MYSSPSAAGRSASPAHAITSPQRTMHAPNRTSLTNLLHEKGAQKQQQQQQLAQTRTLAPSASTPGLRTIHAQTLTSSPGTLKRPSSASSTPQKQRVQFASSTQANSGVASPIRRSPSGGGLGSTPTRSLTILPPMSPNQPIPVEEGKEEGDATNDDDVVDKSLQEISPRFLTHSADLNLTHGLQLLRENLDKLLPNTLLRSQRYRSRVEVLLNDLTRNAQHVHDMSVAKNALLERSIDEKTTAEASERRYRTSIANLGLQSWGNLSELQQDIASIEREIVERGRFTVEDQTSVGVGLQFGIESVETKAEAAARGKLKPSKGNLRDEATMADLLNESLNLNNSVTDLPKSTSQLVYLKFRRLEQLIYILKRKLSILENYPHQSEIDRKYGNLEGLLKHVEKLEQENMKLESRLSTGALKYKEDALLKTRNLNTYPPAFLHLLIVSLQQTLQSYMTSVDESIGVGKEFGNTRHPLYSLVKSWSHDVEKEARKLDVQLMSKNKRSSQTAKDKEGGNNNNLILTLDSTKEKLDIDELYQNLVVGKKPAQPEHASGSNKVLRAAGSSNAPTTKDTGASAAALLESQNQLSAASLEISALQFENDLLRKELKNAQWMESILKQEGFIPSRSGTELARTASMDSFTSHATDGDAEIHIESTTSLHNDDESKEQEQAIAEDQREDGGENDTSINENNHSFNHLDVSVESESHGDEDQVPPTVVRAITITAPPPTVSAASPSAPRVSKISRTLLKHLQTYSAEVSRYQKFVAQYQRLHVSREQALATAQREKGQLVKIMLHLLKKYPQLHDANAAHLAHTNSRNARLARASGGPEVLSAYPDTHTPQPGSRNLSRRPSIDKSVGAEAR